MTALTSAITEHVANACYSDLSTEVIEATKCSILDMLGVMLGATTLGESQRRIHALMSSMGGTPESTLVGFGGKTSALSAAFVNGSLAHALDLDDTTDNPPPHPTASTLPTALALAERRGNVSGSDLITAVAVGNDVAVRLACGPDGSVNMDYPFMPISLFGLWGSVTAGTMTLGLSLDQTRNAFGILLHESSGITDSAVHPESDLRSYRDGFTNQCGALAALLAEAGMTAVRSRSLEIFFHSFYADRYQPERILDGLGSYGHASKISLKPWPCDREIHGYIEGALAIRAQGDLSPSEIADVVVSVGPFGKTHLCEPLADKRAPRLVIGARLSLPYVVALALTRGRVGISDFSEENLDDVHVLAVASRVRYAFDPNVGVPPGTGTPAKISVRTKDGREFIYVVDTLLGNPMKPMTTTQLEAKFRDCASYSASPIPRSKVADIIAMIWDLECVTDICQLTAMLA